MFGLAATLFYVTYVIFGIPSNMMLSRVGARRWIATIMVLWGIASTCTMFATGPTSLYVLRMIVGITEAGFLPGILVYLTYWFPAFYRARANALFMIAMPVTMAIGSLVSGYITALDGVMNLKGLAVAVPAGRHSVGAAGRGGVVLPRRYAGQGQVADRRGESQPAGDDGGRQAAAGAAQRAEQPPRAATAQPVARICTPIVLMYTLAYFCLTNTLSAINIWTPQILRKASTRAAAT